MLAIYGPDLTPESTTVLIGLGLMQIIEPKIPFFGSRAGSIISFLIKLALWYILMGWTDGICQPLLLADAAAGDVGGHFLGIGRTGGGRGSGLRRISLSALLPAARSTLFRPISGPS